MDEKERVERWRNSGNHRLFVHKKLIRNEITDTERLEFMMQFFRIDDLEGDDCPPSMVVLTDDLRRAFDYGPLVDEECSLASGGWKNPDMRRVIDKAMAASKGGE